MGIVYHGEITSPDLVRACVSPTPWGACGCEPHAVIGTRAGWGDLARCTSLQPMASPLSSPTSASPAPTSTSARDVDSLERVILVDEHDRPLGTANKLEAHRDEGALHRAFSIFVFDARGRMLMQQRAATKYHFPLLWTNACCSHPRPGESVEQAATRRAREELGVELQPRPAFSFVYEARDERTGLIEREFDHVVIARLDEEPAPNPDEIAALEWVDPQALLRDVDARPDRYTPWLRVAMPKLAERGLLGPSA